MSVREIEIQFERVKELTEELGQTAEKIQKMASEQGRESVFALKAVWVSENADMFIKKEEKLLQEIQESAQSLTVISTDIQEKAGRLYEAEKWNCLMARARSYR